MIDDRTWYISHKVCSEEDFTGSFPRQNHMYYFIFEVIESVTKCKRVSLVLSAELVNAQPSPPTPAMISSSFIPS